MKRSLGIPRSEPGRRIRCQVRRDAVAPWACPRRQIQRRVDFCLGRRRQRRRRGTPGQRAREIGRHPLDFRRVAVMAPGDRHQVAAAIDRRIAGRLLGRALRGDEQRGGDDDGRYRHLSDEATGQSVLAHPHGSNLYVAPPSCSAMRHARPGAAARFSLMTHAVSHSVQYRDLGSNMRSCAPVISLRQCEHKAGLSGFRPSAARQSAREI